jgi:hypothetical protein
MIIFKKIGDFIVCWGEMIYEYRKYHKMHGMY